MRKEEITKFFSDYVPKRKRTIALVDFGNVEKWKDSLRWRIGIRELARLVKNFSIESKFLRRFYYGADFGSNEKSTKLTEWSRYVLETANINGFEVIDKRVKYIHTSDNVYGFEKKCDLDVEMTVDLFREIDKYDTIVLFSGDGDLMYALSYLKEKFKKESIVISARGHVGREVIDAKKSGIISEILFAEDFEYRLNMDRFRGFQKHHS